MRPDRFLLPSITLFTLAQAWPWPPSFADGSMKAVQGIEGLFRRQNGGSTTAPTKATATQTGTATATAKTSGNTSGASGSNTASITATGDSTATISGGSFASGNDSNPSFDPRDPAGGISMITPAATAVSQYYKIGDWVTFAWNYTSLQASPTAINIVASCSQNQHTYTLASNQSFQATPSILWDTSVYQSAGQQPLLTNQYTLIVWDAAEAITAAPQAGYLSSYSQFRFGMYEPQPYEPFSDFQCPTCNGASSFERQTVKFLLAMSGITVLSFTWFAASFNIL